MKIQNTFQVLAVLKPCSLFGPIPPLLSHFFYICSSSTSTKLGTYIFLTILRDLLFTAVKNFYILPKIRTFQTFLYETSAYSPPRASRSPLYATLALAVYNARHNYLSMGKCNYLIYTAPVLGPHLRF